MKVTTYVLVVAFAVYGARFFCLSYAAAVFVAFFCDVVVSLFVVASSLVFSSVFVFAVCVVSLKKLIFSDT